VRRSYQIGENAGIYIYISFHIFDVFDVSFLMCLMFLIQSLLRIGDVYALLVEHYHSTGNFDKAYEYIQDMLTRDFKWSQLNQVDIYVSIFVYMYMFTVY